MKLLQQKQMLSQCQNLAIVSKVCSESKWDFQSKRGRGSNWAKTFKGQDIIQLPGLKYELREKRFIKQNRVKLSTYYSYHQTNLIFCSKRPDWLIFFLENLIWYEGTSNIGPRQIEMKLGKLLGSNFVDGGPLYDR